MRTSLLLLAACNPDPKPAEMPEVCDVEAVPDDATRTYGWQDDDT